MILVLDVNEGPCTVIQDEYKENPRSYVEIVELPDNNANISTDDSNNEWKDLVPDCSSFVTPTSSVMPEPEEFLLPPLPQQNLLHRPIFPMMSHPPTSGITHQHLSLLGSQHLYPRRTMSLYSPNQGHSLADKILSESGINRSLSFGMRGQGPPAFSEVGRVVRTNIQEHIEILNQHKNSIMNMMKEE